MSDYTKPNNKRELLAQTVADAMGDSHRMSLYLQQCQKYPQHLVLRAYSEAKSIPLERIRKARAAVFFFLLKQYDDERKKPRCR